MSEAQRNPDLLERLTPSTPVRRPEAVVWAAWLLMAAYLCLLVAIADLWIADLPSEADISPSLTYMLFWLGAMTVGIVGLAVWQAYSLMSLRPAARPWLTPLRPFSALYLLVPMLFLGIGRWQAAGDLAQQLGGTPEAHAYTLIRFSLWVLLVLLYLMLTVIVRKMTSREAVAAAFAAAAEARDR